jgi:hypothetical protein
MARKSSAPKTATKRRVASRTRSRTTNGNGKLSETDARNLRTLLALYENVKKYSPIIRKKLRAAGVKPDPAVVYSAAMYYETLDRLAKE